MMPYTMFIEIQANDSVILKDPLGPFICVAEQLVTNLRVFQCQRLHVYVPASQHIEDVKHKLCGCLS